MARTYRRQAVTPVIVEARPRAFGDVKARLRGIVPVELLEATWHTFLPRVRALIEFPISKWKEIPTFNMVATVLTPGLIEEVAQWRDVERIYPDYMEWALEGVFRDGKGNPFTSTYWTKQTLGLTRANLRGLTGRGVTAVVIDTGVRVLHEQLRRTRALTAMPEKGGSGEDSNGHGSWCAATLGGVYARDRRYDAQVEGMAPECTLVSIQALGFIVGMGTTSDILKAMEMSLELGAKVVSMSLGSNEAVKDADNPEAVAVDELVKNDIIPCIAAGNSGPEPKTVGSPGSCQNSLTVGAWDELAGNLAGFSSRGPTADDYVKPDVVMPGVRVDSALVGLLDALTDKSEPKYGPISGTSMATPHAAGLVTCMAQLYREKLGKELTVDEVKRMMAGLGHAKSNEDGWGMLDWRVVETWLSTEYGLTI